MKKSDLPAVRHPHDDAGLRAGAGSSVSLSGRRGEVRLPPLRRPVSDFKGVLPGDVIQQTITVQNNTSKQVRIYLRADKVSDNDVDFLSKLHLQVTAMSGDIFDAQASETAQRRTTPSWAPSRNGSTTLTVTLTVPAQSGQRVHGPPGRRAVDLPCRGNRRGCHPVHRRLVQPAVWIGIAVLILCAMTAVVLVKRRKTASK
jgi:hypothetical protein